MLYLLSQGGYGFDILHEDNPWPGLNLESRFLTIDRRTFFTNFSKTWTLVISFELWGIGQVKSYFLASYVVFRELSLNYAVGTSVTDHIFVLENKCFWKKYSDLHKITSNNLSSEIVRNILDETDAQHAILCDIFWDLHFNNLLVTAYSRIWM